MLCFISYKTPSTEFKRINISMDMHTRGIIGYG